MTKIHFTKMQALGNDFMVLDGVRQKLNLSAAQIRHWADRHLGIGFDQCLVLEPAPNDNFDFNYRIFNADGNEVSQCGNGARALALFVHTHGLSNNKVLRFATQNGKLEVRAHQDTSYSVDFPPPKLKPQAIPLLMPTLAPQYTLDFTDGTQCQVHAIQVGNPHAVIQVKDLATAKVATLGAAISQHPAFPEQCNVGFIQIVSKHEIHLRVFERGAGETQACGSGAVAAAAIGRLYHKLDNTIKVQLPGGNLLVSWPNMQGPITLRGPAKLVYEGILY